MSDSVELADQPTGTVLDGVIYWENEKKLGGFEPLGTLAAGGIEMKPSYAKTETTWTHTVTDATVETYTISVPASSIVWGGGLLSSDNGSRTAKPHECPHCFRQTHPEPLTRRMAEMYDSHKFDPAYDAATDDSGVVCIGANYHGPATVNAPQRICEYWTGWGGGGGGGGEYTYQEHFAPNPAYKNLQKMQALYSGLITYIDTGTWSFLPDNQYLPVGPEPECDELAITYNDPDNWKPWEKPDEPLPALAIAPHEWRASFPTPKAPGYDFTAYKSSGYYDYSAFTDPPKKGKKAK